METWLGPLAGEAIRGRVTSVIGRGDNPIPFVGRGDVARVLVEEVLLASAARMRRIAVGGPERISFRGVVELAGQLAGRPAPIRRRSPLWARTSSALLRSVDPVRARLLRTAGWLEEADHPPTPAEVLSTYGSFLSVRVFLQSRLPVAG